MNIEILQPITAKNPQNVYQITVNFMHGDADAYSSEVFGPYNKDDEFEMADMKEVLTVLAAVKVKSDEEYQLTDLEDLEAIPGFAAKLQDEWPTDSTCDDYMADYQDHYVRFFDENGVEFQTKVTL